MFFILTTLVKVGIEATIIAAHGADFVGGHMTEIWLWALLAPAEVVAGNFGLHSASAEGDFCTFSRLRLWSKPKLHLQSVSSVN